MPRLPSEWTAEDWRLIAHALARAARDADVDEEHALELVGGVADREGVSPPDLVRA